MLAKKSSTFLFIVLFHSSWLFGETENITYSKAVALYRKELIQQHDNQLLTSKVFVYKWEKDDFRKPAEWEAFMEYCLKEVKTQSEAEYYALCFDLGENLSLHGSFQDAFPYLFRVEEFLRGKSPADVPYYYGFQHRMGLVYYNFKRFYLAKKYFRVLMKDQKAPINLKINAYNSIGLIHKLANRLDSSQMYFEKGLWLARKNNREDWVGIISGNLGDCYYKRHKIDQAWPLIEIDYKNSFKSEQWESAMMALIALARIDIDKQRLEAAQKKLGMADDLMSHYYHNANVKQSYWQTMALLEEKTGDYHAAFTAQQRYLDYLDTINEQEELVNFHNTEFQIEFQKKQAQIKLLASKKKRAEQILILSIGIVCCVILGLIIVVRQIILKRRKEREILTLQKLRAEDELKNVDSQMRLVLSNLGEKNDLIDQLQQEIEQYNSTVPTLETSPDQIQLLDKLQSFKLLTSDDWDVFRKLFEKLHPGFFDRFEQLSQEITKADLRLVALIRLKSSTNEMAKILGISIESVQRTHLRLRKKLELEQAIDLERLIRSL
ncbi:MAG: hypothetical protein V4604_00965 [Bacteroidota bacterium]